jgi:peroxiredoxin
VYKQWKQTGVKFVGLGLLDTQEACRAFVARYQLSFPNGYDADSQIAKRYGFTYQPYWAVIDREGRIVKNGYGPSGEDELVAAVRALTGR